MLTSTYTHGWLHRDRDRKKHTLIDFKSISFLLVRRLTSLPTHRCLEVTVLLLVSELRHILCARFDQDMY
jgi:hypothetical protein